MQSILITGANGFLGYYLVSKLLTADVTVLATGKGPNRLPFTASHFLYEEMDFTDEAKVGQVFDRYRPEVVIHCGAMSKPDECEQYREAAFLTNVTGTLHLLSHAEKHKSFFLFLSTDFIFSGDRGMYREEDLPAPVNFYGESKLLAEGEVMKYKGPWSIVRTVLVYGKTFLNRQNIVTSTATALRKGQELKIFNDQVRTPTYVEDLAEGIIRIIQRKEEGVFHLSGEDILTPYQIALAVANHLHLDSRLITPVAEHEFEQPARRPPRTGFDISKARTILGYTPLAFEEGLKKTLDNQT